MIRPLCPSPLVSAALLGVGLACAGPLSAQDPSIPTASASDVVDRVAAVVGDSVILLSQVQEEIVRLRARGMEIPSDRAGQAQIQREVLDQLVNQQVILQAALQDSLISVDEERLDQVVDEELEARVRSFGGREALQRALAEQGMTMAAFRERIREYARREQLQQQLLLRLSRSAGEVRVDESEVRELYESRRAQLARRPATITFRQAVVRPEPSDSAREAARVEAERILEMARSGEHEFEDLARRFSDDPGSRQQGGDLGWFRRGAMVPAFEDAAFALYPGQISEVVETDFGFHIIKVERARGPERKARHILVAPEVSEADVERARRRAGEIRERIAAGEPFDEFVLEEPFPGSPPDSLTVSRDRLSESLPPSFAEALAGASVGDLIGPLEFRLTPGSDELPLFSVIRVAEIREEGEFLYEEVRDRIREQIREQRTLERVIQTLREQTYIDVRI